MATFKIDPDIFVEVYITTSNAAEAYRKAGGQGKDAKQSAYQVLKRKDVKLKIEEAQRDVMSNMRTVTLGKLDFFYKHTYEDLSPRDQGAFLIKMIEKTGLDVEATKPDATRTPVMIDVTAMAKQLADMMLKEPSIENRFGKATSGTLIEQSRVSEQDGSESPDSGEEQT